MGIYGWPMAMAATRPMYMRFSMAVTVVMIMAVPPFKLKPYRVFYFCIEGFPHTRQAFIEQFANFRVNKITGKAHNRMGKRIGYVLRFLDIGFISFTLARG